MVRLFFILFICFSSHAFAVLGGAPSDIWQNNLTHPAQHSNVQKNGYSISVTTDRQNVVKEYVDTQGVVFAVTWRSSVHYHLPKLLGSYWPKIKAAMQNHKSYRRQPFSRAEFNDVVIERGGHMGRLVGQAYVKSLVPTGFQLKDLQ